MEIQVAAATHVGRVRTENQDALLVSEWATQVSGAMYEGSFMLGRQPIIFAVVDGMGGHAGGALASTLCARTLAGTAPALPLGFEAADLVRAVEECNRNLVTMGHLIPGHSDMGATLAGVVMSEGGFDVFNVGDSRVYRLRGAYLGQLSVDDRVPDPRGVRSALVSQCLGGGAERVLDIHHLRLEPEQQTTLLLCSDGLHDAVPSEDISAALSNLSSEQESSPHVAVQRLIRMALEAGAPDNVSVILIHTTGGGKS